LLISTRPLLIPYYLLIIIGLVLPSDGSHGIFSPKSFTFILSTLSITTIALFRKRIAPSQIPLALFACIYFMFLSFWLIIGLTHPTTQLSQSLDQGKLFLITLSVPLMTAYLHQEKLIHLPTVTRLMIYSNFAYCISKVALIIFQISGLIDIWAVMRSSGFMFMTMNMFGEMQRLQTSVDISTPFLFMFALFSDRLGLAIKPRTRALYLVIALISNFFTFSRFLLFTQFAAFVLYLITLNLKQIQKAVLIGLFFLAAAIISIGPQNVLESIDQRFFSRNNTLSDQARVEQVNAMMEHYSHSPYFGAGLGAHAPKSIREQKNLHSYEVQWVAFLMQFGIIGMTILISLLFFVAFPLLTPPLSRTRLAFLGLLFLWIVSGFTNPFLISLQSGIIYTLFLMAGWELQRPSETIPAITKE
jgi:hypothetical protein